MLALFITTSLRNYVVYELLGFWHCFAAFVYELNSHAHTTFHQRRHVNAHLFLDLRL